MFVAAAARSILRSAASRTASTVARAPMPGGSSKPTFSAFCRSKQIPLNPRFFRTPVELSFCVETLLPYHTATASALLTSMLSVSRAGYGWTLEGQSKPS